MLNNMQECSAGFIFSIFSILQYAEYAEYVRQYAAACKKNAEYAAKYANK